MNRLTIPEYHLLEKAARLREADKDYRNHLQAFLNLAVKATKKVGKRKQKPVYSNFRKFYDHEKAIDKILDRKKKDGLSGVREFMKRKEEAYGGKL